MLDAVGITGTAARVYSELVETDQLSAAQVAERCAISARQAAAELRSIASLGLAFRVTGRPVRYRAVAPDLAISTLIAQRESELRNARATMHRLTETFLETSRARHPDAHVEVVHGTPNIARLAVRVYEQTERQLRGFDRPPYSQDPGTSYSVESSRLAAGVTYRIIYDSAALMIPGRMRDDIIPSSAAGELARTRPELPIKLIISDDQLALIPAAVSSRSIDTTFVIHRSPILDALVALFEAEWVKATPIPGTAATPGAADGMPDPETAILLAMLAAGMTDAAIARSRSWSMRTTQRRMHQLMTDLGVTSRFQAGVAAREKGWL
ncbi:MAG TPA: helix-turn-helix domain-containing protein [Streptosporangiaceae bacterium]|nr:helix-turn-helix domain-containing protein [Streptosporangiaceae bacterium]